MLDPRTVFYPSIVYRPIQPRDLDVLEQIHISLFPVRYEREFFINVVNGNGIVSWGAYIGSSDGRGDDLIGFITTRMVWVNDSEIEDLFRYNPSRKELSLVYILTLGVVKQYRNLGIATSLVQEAIKHATSLSNCRGVYLHVISYNQPAISFYQKMLFKLERRLPMFYFIKGRHYDSYLFIYYVNGGRSPCSPLDLVSSLVMYLGGILKSLVTKLWSKDEEKDPRWQRCKESTSLLMASHNKRVISNDDSPSLYV